ncbi:hypothetical protein V1281_007016 [Nitrobacteraceae bacterium AZCC 2161]
MCGAASSCPSNTERSQQSDCRRTVNPPCLGGFTTSKSRESSLLRTVAACLVISISVAQARSAYDGSWDSFF